MGTASGVLKKRQVAGRWAPWCHDRAHAAWAGRQGVRRDRWQVARGQGT